MNELQVTIESAVPGAASSRVYLNGEDVTNDTVKIEINVADMLLHRFTTERKVVDGELLTIVTPIHKIKVN